MKHRELLLAIEEHLNVKQAREACERTRYGGRARTAHPFPPRVRPLRKRLPAHSKERSQ